MWFAFPVVNRKGIAMSGSIKNECRCLCNKSYGETTIYYTLGGGNNTHQAILCVSPVVDNTTLPLLYTIPGAKYTSSIFSIFRIHSVLSSSSVIGISFND